MDKYADLFSDGLQALLKESLIRRIPELYAGLLVNLSAVQMYPAVWYILVLLITRNMIMNKQKRDLPRRISCIVRMEVQIYVI